MLFRELGNSIIGNFMSIIRPAYHTGASSVRKTIFTDRSVYRVISNDDDHHPTQKTIHVHSLRVHICIHSKIEIFVYIVVDKITTCICIKLGFTNKTCSGSLWVNCIV